MENIIIIVVLYLNGCTPLYKNIVNVQMLAYTHAKTQASYESVDSFCLLRCSTHLYGTDTHTQMHTHTSKQSLCQHLPTHQPVTTSQLPYACSWYRQTTQNTLPRSNHSERVPLWFVMSRYYEKKLTGNVLSRQTEFTAGKLIVDIMKQ